MMIKNIIACWFLFGIGCYFCLTPLAFSSEIKLIGASQYDKDHIYGQIIRYFGYRIRENYNKPIKIDFHHKDYNSLGTEKDFAVLMYRGLLDFAIIAPSHAANISKEGAFLDIPFLFKDHKHWEKAINSGALNPIVDLMLKKNIRVVGFAGGATRNIFSVIEKEIKTVADLKGVWIRVMNSPIQNDIFRAIGMRPRPMPYDKIRSYLDARGILAAENEATGVFEHADIAPNVTLTMHSITVRPICFSESRFKKLPLDLQAAILKAGKETEKWARETESFLDQDRLQHLVDNNVITVHDFSERDKLFELVAPVKEKYAKELEVEEVLKAVNKLISE